jgi:DNA-directed RNA polymerase subunit RPC12/RpoP
LKPSQEPEAMSSSMKPRVSPHVAAAPEKGAVEKLPPTDRKFPCAKCGARLDFDPASHALKCPYCGYLKKIEPTAQHVQERDWDEYWRNSSGQEVKPTGRSSQVTCTTCGAVVLLEDKVATDKCPYCGAFLENQPESVKAMIPPEGVLAFAITDRRARQAFNGWIAGRWFAPSGLYKFADLGRLSSIYVPFWTYDSMTYTHYTGERGDVYPEIVTYTETDANRQIVTKTRQVMRVRWTPVSGQVRHFFDDVLICASRGVPAGLIHQLMPWDLPELEDCRLVLLSGFQTERYAVDLREGFERARSIMNAEIRRHCVRDIGGNQQRLHSVRTQHVGITFKHILLPVWLAAYRYQDRTYQILVNGRSGKVVGTRPYSWVKITLLVLVTAAVLAAVLWLFASRAHGAFAGGGLAPSTPSFSVEPESRRIGRMRADSIRGNPLDRRFSAFYLGINHNPPQFLTGKPP